MTSGDDKETESKNKDTWVRVTFDTGAGTAPLDPASVTASDFRVDGATPLDAKVNAVTHGDAAKGTAVYLQVGALDTDAKPRVELTGEVKDKADNIRSDGRIAAAADGLAPKLTVTPSADIAKSSVTITITSSETLRSNPMLELTTTKPEKGKDLSSPTTRPVSLQTGSLTTWTGSFSNPSGQASIQYVAVAGSDAAGNDAKVGRAATESDIVSFQVDSKKPSLMFKSASGKDLATKTAADKPEEGAVWIVMEFDDDEYTGDTFRKVEVTSIKLMNKDTEEVITDDVGMVFDTDNAPCGTGHGTTDTRDGQKCAERTLAVDLMPGMYNVAVTFADQAGNEDTKNTDFEVVAKKPFTP